jgi:hypothetical protein
MLLGKEIALHPTTDGAEFCHTAEVSEEYARLLRLVTDKISLVEGSRYAHRWYQDFALKSTE